MRSHYSAHVHTAAKFSRQFTFYSLIAFCNVHTQLTSDNRIYRNSTQCVRNWTEQLIVNYSFERVCEMQENNSERSFNLAQG